MLALGGPVSVFFSGRVKLNTNLQSLGQLVRAELRDVWESEAGDFTPWLARAENLKLLADTIGIAVELDSREKFVGPFRADIFCKNVATSRGVVIENQLDRTDHSHLGQLLTYAAGLDADTVVWVAAQFTDEHRAVIDWLNRISGEQFSFFGLEVELWRIGDSPAAPKFNVVCKPNDWTREIDDPPTPELTEAKRLQLEFWTTFRAFVESRGSVIRPTKPLPQNWMNLSIGRTGFKLNAIASLWDSVSNSYETNEVRAELIIDSPDAKRHFTALSEQRASIEAGAGEPLTWHNPPEARMCRVSLRKSTNLRDKGQWPAQHAWLLDKLERLHQVLADRVRLLPD